MVDEKEKIRREIEVLKQEVVKDLDAFRGEFQGITESLAAAKEATQESNAKLGMRYFVICRGFAALLKDPERSLWMTRTNQLGRVGGVKEADRPYCSTAKNLVHFNFICRRYLSRSLSLYINLSC